jgi:hypothetical protein
MRKYIVVFSILMALSACKKETEPAPPTIKLISVSSTELLQFKDSLVITLEYTDVNGDIGEDDPDLNDLMVKDRRLSNADYYFVKPLSPPSSGIKINGIIAVQIKNAFLLGTGNSEITQFDIKLKDRAGNWSNSVSTPEITIKK